MTALTEDSFLGGRVIVQQPAQGFRSGLDAVMLAAAVPAQGDDDLLELGCGAGAASLCLVARVPRCRIAGTDKISSLVDLAKRNAHANRMESQLMFVAGDALSLPSELSREYDHVFCNPPFHGAAGERSPDRDRALALGDEGRLGEWLASGLKRTRSRGTFTAIVRADRLGEVLAHLPAEGAVLFPLWPHEGEAAKRVIVQVRKSSRAPLVLLPGLVLHEADGRHTRAVEAILRDGASLALMSRPL